MSFDPSLTEQELLEDTLRRSAQPMRRREVIAAVMSVIALASSTAAVWSIAPPHPFPLVPALICLLVLAVASTIPFDTPLGFTVPTQLAFVPLLFAMPVALVPIAVPLAFVLAKLPHVVRGRVRPSRLLLQLTNGWFSIGPVAVFAIAHVEPQHAGAALLLAALAAQFIVDLDRFVGEDRRHARRAACPRIFSATWVYGIDAALSGVGLVVAEEIHATPLAPLALVPLLGLLAVFAHERRRRLESMLELSSAYRGTALVLGDVIEADDGYTGEHCKSVVSLALELAEHLKLTPERRRNLEFAALLHDVGKIAIPKEIINKPGKLDPGEWTIIKTHTLEGQKMLDRVGGFMREVGQNRPLPPRTLGRHRLPRRPRPRADPPRGPHHHLLRHLERDAHRPPVPQRPRPRRRHRGARLRRRHPTRPEHRRRADRDRRPRGPHVRGLRIRGSRVRDTNVRGSRVRGPEGTRRHSRCSRCATAAA